MAQQFVLKGVKELRDVQPAADGSFDFLVKQDPRGGFTWQIPQWWAKKKGNTIYQSCTVIDIQDTNYLMIIPTSMDTQLQVTYDDDIYQLALSNFNAVERVLITDKTTKNIVLEYLLPSISGGAVAKRIVQQSNEIGDFTITGKSDVDVPSSTSYKSNATPPPNMVVTYAWTITEGGVAVPPTSAEITAGGTQPGCTVSWKKAGNYDLKCEITADANTPATDSPKSDTKPVTATVPITVGTAEVIGSTTPEAQQAEQYQTILTGSTAPADSLSYAWSVGGGDASIGNTVDPAIVNITFQVKGDYQVKCDVNTSAGDGDSSHAELGVNASGSKYIGIVTIEGDKNPQAATATNYQATDDGTVSDQQYAWSYSPNDGTVNIADPNTQTPTITFNKAGGYTLTCEITSTAANNSPQSNTYPVDAAALEGIAGVTLAGSQNISTLDLFNVYTSNTSDGSTLIGNTTYLWSAEDSNGDTSDSNGAVFSTEAGKTKTDQNTEIKFTKDNEVYAIRCKWTNDAYTDPKKTGMRTVSVDHPDLGSVSITPVGPLDLTTGVASQALTAAVSGSASVDSWAWTSNAETKVSFGTPASATTTVTCSEDGDYTITATATSASADPSTASISKAIHSKTA